MNHARKYLLVFVDGLIISLAYFLSIIVKEDFVIDIAFNKIITDIAVVVIIYWLIFFFFNMYSSLWEHASIEEVIRSVFANMISAIISFFVLLVLGSSYFLLSNLIIVFLITTFLTSSIRVSYRIGRIVKNHVKTKDYKQRALIVGAGSAGNLILREFRNNPSFNVNVVGFIDDDQNKLHKTVNGVKVLGSLKEIVELSKQYNINKIVIAMPSANKTEIQEIIKECEKTKCSLKILPPFYEVIDPNVNVSKLRDIKIEDLLGRDQIVLDTEGIGKYLIGKKVLVTGGGGSIGSELCRQIVKFSPKELIIIDIYENNAYEIEIELRDYLKCNEINDTKLTVLIASIRDEQRINDIFNDYKPNVVFHAAAHKHVPLMENSPKEAIKNNVFGTLNVVRAADEHNVEKFVLISSDKAVNPTNIMGATKRFAEMIIQAFNKDSKTDYAAVRFGNVLGSNGSVIPLFKKQIKNGGPITVTHKDIIRYFMTIPEACQLVLQAGAYAEGGEIFVLDMGDQVKIVDLAERLIRLSGLEPYEDIDIVFTGLRPGEKLYEELLMDEEGLKETRNKKIFISEVKPQERKELRTNLNEINNIIDVLEDQEFKELVGKHVPTYKVYRGQ